MLEKHPIKTNLFELDLYQKLLNAMCFFNKRNYYNLSHHAKHHNIRDFIELFNHLDEAAFQLKLHDEFGPIFGFFLLLMNAIFKNFCLTDAIKQKTDPID